MEPCLRVKKDGLTRGPKGKSKKTPEPDLSVRPRGLAAKEGKSCVEEPHRFGRLGQIRATPLFRAASATALATAGPTRLSKALGMM